MAIIRGKIWLFGVFFFFLVLASSSYLLAQTILGHTFVGADFFKSNVLGEESGPKVIILLISILIAFFAFLLTESLSQTSIITGRFSSHIKNRWISMVAITGIVAASVYLSYLTYNAIDIQNSDISKGIAALGDNSKDTTTSILLIDIFVIAFSCIYPFLLLSIPFGAQYLISLFEKHEVFEIKLGKLCIVGIVSLFIIIPLYLSNTFIVFNMISRPFSEIVGLSLTVFGFTAFDFSAILYIIIFSCLGVLLIHTVSLQTFRKISIFNLLVICVCIVFISFAIGANLLHQIREIILLDAASTMNALTGQESSMQLPEDTALDKTLKFLLTNMIFILLLLAGYITRVLRCMLLGKLYPTKNV